MFGCKPFKSHFLANIPPVSFWGDLKANFFSFGNPGPFFGKKGGNLNFLEIRGVEFFFCFFGNNSGQGDKKTAGKKKGFFFKGTGEGPICFYYSSGGPRGGRFFSDGKKTKGKKKIGEGFEFGGTGKHFSYKQFNPRGYYIFFFFVGF